MGLGMGTPWTSTVAAHLSYSSYIRGNPIPLRHVSTSISALKMHALDIEAGTHTSGVRPTYRTSLCLPGRWLCLDVSTEIWRLLSNRGAFKEKKSGVYCYDVSGSLHSSLLWRAAFAVHRGCSAIPRRLATGDYDTDVALESFFPLPVD